MISPSFLVVGSIGVLGVALSADSGFDWGDPDEEYESPFADEVDDEDEAPEAPTENPFASANDESEGNESTSPATNGGVPLNAEGLASVGEARSLCDAAMSALHEADTEQAFDQLATHWAFSSDEMTQLQREVERTRAVVADRYGDALDYQLVREDAVDEVLVRFVYIERFELHGLRWRFTFYRGPNGWALNDVYFDDEIEALLE